MNAEIVTDGQGCSQFKRMNRLTLTSLALSVLLLSSACGVEAHCVPGTSQACSCTDGRMGAQLCQTNGAYASCTCTGTMSTGGGMGSGGGTGSGGGGGGGGGGLAGTKRVFVTSTTYTGDLDGINGADSKCNLSAQAGGLSGTWVAWVSSDAAKAIDRITGNGPWMLLNTTRAFNNKANLSTLPLVPINIDENGHQATSPRSVWTGTNSGGGASSSNCSGWNSTGTYGSVGDFATVSDWTASSTDGCNQTAHLYCFEQ